MKGAREVIGETHGKRNKRRGREMTHNGHTLSGRLTWKGTGHAVSGKWMMTCGMDHINRKRGDGRMAR
jgi:hypothetical protein